MEFTFKIGQKIKEAWPTYKAHFSTFLIMMLVMSGIQYIGTKENFITMIIYYLALALFMYVFLRFVIGLVDKKENNSFSKEMFTVLIFFNNTVFAPFLGIVIITID